MTFAYRGFLLGICIFLVLALSAPAATVNATWNTAADVPVSASSYTATGSTVNFTLNFYPPTGTNLKVVNNTGLPFISGTFANLAQGQAVNLSYNGLSYSFVANYYSGTGNDLVLVWASNRPLAWGSDAYGQLGNSVTTTSPSPVAVNTAGVLAGKTVTAIANGPNLTLALCSDGTLAAWGNNVYGQLGNGTLATSNLPVAVTTSGTPLAGKTVTAVSVGGTHCLAVCSDGTVAAWGYNNYGQLGNNSTTQSTVPTAVVTAGTPLAGKTVIAVSAGDSHSLALCSDGTMAVWGQNLFGQLGNNSTTTSTVPTAVTTSGVLSGKTVIAVSAGNTHSLALCSDGTVVAWGTGINGRLGNNSTAQSNVPVAVTSSGVLSGKTVIAVSAGNSHSLALCSDGTVAAWGLNTNGQLGNNSTTQSTVPVTVTTSDALSGKTVTAVSAGGSHSLTRCSDGTVAAWGLNSYGQLGSSSLTQSTVPIAVSVSSNALTGKTVSMVASGQNHSAAVCSDGTVAMWGSNSNGQLGNGAAFLFPVPTPGTTTGTPLDGKTLIAHAAGGGHSLGLCSDGTLAAWGSNFNGQLGNNATASSGSVPVAVTASGVLSGKTVIAVSAGNSHSLALCSDGTVAAWGLNTNGQLGNNSTAQSSAPVAVTTSGVLSGKSVIAISAGNSHSLALCSDGTVASWGLNTNGQLGNNSTTQSTVPVAVITSGILSGKSVVAIASGNYHNVVACSDGTVATWGYNFNGQLGNNSTTNSSVPVAVVTSGTPLAGKAVITVSAGYGHCLALCSDGTVAAWGYGIFGQLGNNGTTQRTVPVAVTTSGTLSGRTVIAISAGYYHNLALCADGTLVAWGYGPNGELGTNSTSSTVPVAVNTSVLMPNEKFVQASSMSVANHCLSIIAKPAPAPAIYVQQSAGTNLISGISSVDCGSSVVGAGTTKTLTLGNSGSADLLISNVTIDGVNAADFVITTAPASTVAAGGTTTLVVTFTPGAAFGRNAALHVTSNDLYGSPFDLSLTGSGRAAVSATYNSDVDVPVTTSSFNASGSTVNFTLGYTPVPGTTLMVVKNTGLAFISGTFGNLSQGQAVSLKYNGITYSFVASYYGGTGNDLVLVWAGSRPMAWGNNNNGQLGNNNKTNSSVPVALTTAGTPLAGRTLLALSAGYQHSLALCSDGTLAAWGDNAAGELGTNTNTGSSVPVAVTTAGTPLAGKVAVAVSAGWQYNLVLCADGTLTAWGSNSSGQLGNNSTTNSLVPVAVTTIGTPLAGRAVVAIRTGASHNLALCADGTLATWGNNYYGQLGNNSTTTSLVPVAVTTAGTPLAGKSVVSFAAGATHNIALCSDGTLVTWGYNSFGQLGNNSFTQSNIPVAVTTAGTVLAGKTVIGVAAGSYCSLALCSDGTVASWGSNINGQLGNNSTNDTKVPVGVITSGVLAGKTLVGLMAGGTHSLALCSDGMAAAWGDNTYYQLGNGTTSSNSSTPVAVSTSSLAMGERFMQLVSGSNSGHSLGLVASPAPTATTLASTSITATSAVLNGTVNANGAASTVSFDYGLDDTYGTNVAGVPASITGADDAAVSTTLTGLAPNTTYHFRVTGSNGSGSANGADLTFTTPPLSPLQNWRQTNFGTPANSGSTADAADYDGDSISNLIEYALNLSPTVTSKLPITTALNGANFEYIYSRSTAAVNAGTAFAVEWNGTLTAIWSRSGVTQTVLSDDGTTQQVKAVIPVNAATTLFMRLSVTAPP